MRSSFSQGYTPPDAVASEYQSIPSNKIEDFGVHASRYYSLEVSHFKSSLDNKLLDLLWNKYWVMTLSQSPLITVSRLPFVANDLSIIRAAGLFHLLLPTEPSLHHLSNL